MPQQVCMGAMMTCSFGVAPSSLVVLPENRVLTSNMPAATIMDNKPMVNILPFGMCSSVTNPAVAAATTAAQGVLTPVPCIPATVAPWAPGSPTVMIGNMPALNNTCSLNCVWGGQITISKAGQATHDVA
ncbi:DUF4280 domain-containing protein [Rasiella rasia]|uniref:DUF4280 domain-containing protein n=1 Tax=Rasiella rasia TaxID=2744027 RepID=A0A6G6GMN3_9FLAO|nr:DUF4280 domain-containing protein [Rasiella rasia]QIE59784.1 DUF4280 domain-containing protein [Rasiella rasia]